ncbi:hypothetical protein BMS3Abin16_00530 [archaeon BMS3Abin16]|nr:hypothetical protein BMS3Abin16_00530 [archaeon BMS3Abin16]
MGLIMGYFVLNTDKRYVPGAEEAMIKNKKASAYGSRAHQIDRLRENDRIFLYSNERGIIVRGTAKGKFKEKEFTDKFHDVYDEHYMELKNFENISYNPITHEELKNITGITPSQTLIQLPDEKVAEEIWGAFSGRTK